MADRTFPSDEELHAWLAEKFPERDLPVAIEDQLAAAEHETERLEQGMVERALEPRAIVRATVGLPWDSPSMRVIARAFCAAEMAGVEPLCDHVNQQRPIFVMCDPPYVICMDCFQKESARLQAKAYRWEGMCDACGKQSRTVQSATTHLGHYIVSGHLCPECLTIARIGSRDLTN